MADRDEPVANGSKRSGDDPNTSLPDGLLLDLLDALINDRGRVGAADALGVNYPTMAARCDSRHVSRRGGPRTVSRARMRSPRWWVSRGPLMESFRCPFSSRSSPRLSTPSGWDAPGTVDLSLDSGMEREGGSRARPGTRRGPPHEA